MNDRLGGHPRTVFVLFCFFHSGVYPSTARPIRKDLPRTKVPIGTALRINKIRYTLLYKNLFDKNVEPEIDLPKF